MNIEDLKAQADALGIKYSPNIGVDKLQAKIDAYSSEEGTEVYEKVENKRIEQKPEELTFSQKVANNKKKAFKRSKVIIYNNDPRERDFTTTMSRVQNSYFGSAKVIPIGQEWWLEQMHIDNLKSIEILTYVKDTKTGNSVAKKTRKFTIDILDTDEEAALKRAKAK